ncbi:MAG: histidine kinase [Actinomycetota bacterium]|nr:histidine kinase [Actinomycetota bacterium]
MSTVVIGPSTRARPRLPALRYLLLLLGVGATAVIATLIAPDTDSTYGGAAAWLLWLEAAAAIALLAVPLFGAASSGGVLFGVAGASWLVPELAGWLGGPVGLTTVSDAWARGLAATVVVAAVCRHGASQHRRRFVQVALCGGAASALARLFLVDPFLDPQCWRNCESNPLAWPGRAGLRPWAVGHWVEVVGSLLVAGVAVLAATISLAANRGDPQHSWKAVPAWALACGVAAPGVLRMAWSESATSLPFLVAFLLTQLAAIGTGALLVRDRLAQWRLRSRLTRLAATVAASAPAGSLTPAMRRALPDVGLDIAFWAPARTGYVDAAGRGVDVLAAHARSERRVTVVTRNGDPIAALIHSRRIDGSRVERALGPALRLALENEQLRAATLAELGVLQQSRVRIVERAALERRRLERNLHDGAQQRVVSLALLVRMLAARVERVEDGKAGERGDRSQDSQDSQHSAASALAAQAESLTRATVEELRRVARGIYPAVLADNGLAGALLDLADSSTDLPISLDALPRGRYTGTVETTAYLVVAAAITEARRGGATWLQVRCAESDGRLRLDISGNVAPNAPSPLADLTDQVGALGGTLRVQPQAADGWVRLVLPCAS